jgi:hypothetical protein
MFDPGSRYYGLEDGTLTVTDADGLARTLTYVRRRFIPPLGDATRVLEHRFASGERLDTITARYLGDPTQFWQICDANLVLRPEELEEAVGRVIHVALPRL